MKIEQIQNESEILKNIKRNIENKEDQIKNGEKVIFKGENDKENLKEQKQQFDKISKNLFTKILNYKQYKISKNIDFSSQINEIEI